MAAKTGIEWTDSTWNPFRARNLATGKIGWHCEHVSEACRFCYAEGINRRLGTGLDFKPGRRPDIEIFLDEKMLLAPLRWKTPRRIFVNSMTDTFAEFVKDEWLDRMFAVMALAPQHTFQVLTKRPERTRTYMDYYDREAKWMGAVADLFEVEQKLMDRYYPIMGQRDPWLPLPNVWLGISAEDQATADERIPLLLKTPAAVRFVSLEPLLGPIDLEAMPFPDGDRRHHWSALTGQALMYAEGINGNPDITIRMEKPLRNKIDWAIVGGESGPRARPMHEEWARSLRDQCLASGVPYFFKQWGEYLPGTQYEPHHQARDTEVGEYSRFRHQCWNGEAFEDADEFDESSSDHLTYRVGKKAAGRLLDGREHNGMPSALRETAQSAVQPTEPL